jgi:hypothetical protein
LRHGFWRVFLGIIGYSAERDLSIAAKIGSVWTLRSRDKVGICILHWLWNAPAKAECRSVFCGRNRVGHDAPFSQVLCGKWRSGVQAPGRCANHESIRGVRQKTL